MSTAPNPFLQGVMETASVLGVAPEEVATIFSFETGGTMDPMQLGPTTKWGQHRGLIQFGQPQAQQFGVDFSSPQAALMSQLGAQGAIVKYALAHGFQPGVHSALDLYSTINAGAPGRYGASDAAAGGTPGDVQTKFEQEMAAHRAKVYPMFGKEYDGAPITGAPSGYVDYMNQHIAAGGDELDLPEDLRDERLTLLADLLAEFSAPMEPLDLEPAYVAPVEAIPT